MFKKALILALLGVLLVLSFSKMGLAESEGYAITDQDDWIVEWSLIEDRSSKITYEATIQNKLNNPRNFDLQVFYDEINGLDADLILYEWKTQPVTRNAISWDCYNISDWGNGTREACSQVKTPSVYNIVQWTPSTTGQGMIKTEQKISEDHGNINHPGYNESLTTDDDGTVITSGGTKKYRVEIVNPSMMVFSGRIGFIDKTTGTIYHPITNSTLYTADFTVDNATASDLIIDATNLNSSVSLTNAIGSYWTFDDEETIGSNSVDLLNVLNGTIIGATTGTSCLINECYTYDGVDDAVNFGDGHNFGITEFTVSVWSRTTASGSMRMVGKTAGGGGVFNGYSIDLTTNGAFDMYTDNRPACGFIQVNDGQNYTDGQWHHYVMVMTHNGDTFLQGYVDGQKSHNGSLGCVQNIGNSEDLQTGVNQAGAQDWDGEIDELSIWNRALTADEVMQVYNDAVGKQYPFSKDPFFESITLNTGVEVVNFTPMWSGSHSSNVNVSFDGGSNYVTVSNNVTTPWTQTTKDMLKYIVEMGADETFNDLTISFEEAAPAPPTPPPSGGDVQEQSNLLVTMFIFLLVIVILIGVFLGIARETNLLQKETADQLFSIIAVTAIVGLVLLILVLI